MGLQVTPPPAAVSLDDLGTIKGDALKGVDSDKYDTTICIDAVLGITVSDGMEN